MNTHFGNDFITAYKICTKYVDTRKLKITFQYKLQVIDFAKF